jgi:hypothetical protein
LFASKAARHRRQSLFRSDGIGTVRALAGDLITTTFSAVGKDFSETPRTPAEIEIYADAMADMLFEQPRASLR